MRRRLIKRNLTSFQIIIFGFLALILAGALLLCLPFSTNDGEGASFSDAIFTSTSAACVTGLVVRDTATYWSLFGQTVIMLLIQVGGMGVVTVALSIALLSGRKIGLMQRSVMQESISAPKVGGIVRMTSFILKGVFLIELLGAISLSFVFCRDFGFWKGIWYSVFHSISAFCNAGFDLMGVNAPFSSLTGYASDPIVNITVMLLIIIGGIGFNTWSEVTRKGLRFSKYNMQSKTVLTTTLALIFIPALCFFLFEFDGQNLGDRIFMSLFTSISPRTAGFNTVDLTLIGEAGTAITILLMLIGGSPGSTAGGMKTTTAAVLVANAVSVFKRRENAHLFRRRINDSAVKNAATVFIMYVLMFLLGGIFISMIDGIPLGKCLFETASAIGTVGLSLGITAELSQISRIILISLMFFGRVGGLTIIFAAVSGRGAKVSKYPSEAITVG